MTPEIDPSPTFKVPATVRSTLQILGLMTEINICPKQFMVTFLSSTHPDIIYRRRLMKIGLGAKQTRSIVTNLGKMSKSCDQGQADWEELILDEASKIVNAEELPRGHFPNGSYVSSSRILPDFFSDSSDTIRETQVVTGMRFLYSLIHRKLSFGMNEPSTDHHDDEGDNLPTNSSDMAVTIADSHSEEDSVVMSMENLVCVKSSAAGQASHKLAKVPIMVCAMIAVCCNRRSNAMPMANGLMAFAGGVSCRINEWLHAHGITASRPSLLLALDRLRCVVRATLQAKCEEEAVNLAMFLDAMNKANRKAVQPSSFCPSPADMEHWVAVVKAQIAKALKDYMTYIRGVPEGHCLSSLATRPPSIDPIEMHKANIHFLRMMDAPDSSAEGVSRVLDKIMEQIGVEKKTYAESLLVAGGDVGSNQLVESLRTKRFPPIDSVEGLEWVLSIFGGAHTTWNFTKSLLSLHWGHSDKGDDSGAWRSLFALGAEYKKPVASQDFNTIMRSAQILHKGNLVFIVGSVFIFLWRDLQTLSAYIKLSVPGR
ncbi:uncharacterized protein MELLADRAFT_103911 [Melampsora larici-populina 98AG31]|uniref:DUF6589 domain-containing protein n=1 Tax=Melampsora larici-populina (strain 98AG31 / pathotype 3-4-7) TaxID=747676 RepID=F4RCY7_MELLP|nr:uncharacterized protein MELLADRAFT_103911 [Melampsora larici-populina 98AG31]EGG09907.1 hypothetical protein MELLADRAFT_103911 [Melampsora larici-populina 98AG31]